MARVLAVPPREAAAQDALQVPAQLLRLVLPAGRRPPLRGPLQLRGTDLWGLGFGGGGGG